MTQYIDSIHKVPVGIDAMGFYVPPFFLDLGDLARVRDVSVQKFHHGLGQRKMACPSPDEDIVTMAAEAGARVLTTDEIDEINWLILATETAVDQAKSAGMFVHKLLGLSSRCRVIELKQSCYGATAGLRMGLSLLGVRNKVLLIATDIAKYALGSPAESSQGAGAMAMVLSRNPRMLAIEPESGVHTEDLMDFWRPNHMTEPIVDGKYSCATYISFLQKTWRLYASQSGRDIGTHYGICYHAAIPRLVEKAHAALTGSAAPCETLAHSLAYARDIGNCYTASLYISLLSLLENDHNDIAGKRIGLYSYGSGAIGEFFSGIVSDTYRCMLNRDAHPEMLARRRPLSYEAYEAFHGYRTHCKDLLVPVHKRGGFRFAAISDHKRIYEQ